MHDWHTNRYSARFSKQIDPWKLRKTERKQELITINDSDGRMEFFPLHTVPNYFRECAELLNEEWKRSLNARYKCHWFSRRVIFFSFVKSPGYRYTAVP